MVVVDMQNTYASSGCYLDILGVDISGIIKGTWDYDLIDDIKPQPQDYIVQKPRYSGFWGTYLDMLLRV